MVADHGLLAAGCYSGDVGDQSGKSGERLKTNARINIEMIRQGDGYLFQRRKNSPIPLTVVWMMEAPPRTAASAFAVAMDL